MKVYIVHEYTEDVSSVVAVYATVVKAIALAKSIAANSGLEVSTDCEPDDTVVIEYSDDGYNTVVWVAETEVIE